MAGFSKRRINRQTLNILRKVGQPIACYKQISGFQNELTTRVPTDLYAQDTAPVEADYQKYYIFGLFEQDEDEAFLAEGKVSQVTATITIPWIYRSTLAITQYIDPYLNGSRFIKVGASIDDEQILIIQKIKSLYLPQLPEV